MGQAETNKTQYQAPKVEINPAKEPVIEQKIETETETLIEPEIKKVIWIDKNV